MMLQCSFRRRPSHPAWLALLSSTTDSRRHHDQLPLVLRRGLSAPKAGLVAILARQEKDNLARAPTRKGASSLGRFHSVLKRQLAPPSTTMDWPVMNEEWVLSAKKRMARAISAGAPIRPRAVLRARAANLCSPVCPSLTGRSGPCRSMG